VADPAPANPTPEQIKAQAQTVAERIRAASPEMPDAEVRATVKRLMKQKHWE
jgi:hypothetical protein